MNIRIRTANGTVFSPPKESDNYTYHLKPAFLNLWVAIVL